MNALETRTTQISTEQLIELVLKLHTIETQDAIDVEGAALGELGRRMPTDEYVAFCAKLEG